MYPKNLVAGDEIRIIAPACSLALLSKECQKIANDRLANLVLKVSFGQHVAESDDFVSTSIEARVADIHEAFADKNVKAIITVIGGFNSNQLLKYLDWDLIKNNPKIFCGYSDITVLNNAILAKTGLVSYYGPYYSSFGQKLYFDYTLDYFKKCLFHLDPFEIKASDKWSDDEWYIDQDKRNLLDNPSLLFINAGQARGTIIGGNLCTLNLLQGTEYFPSLENSILFLEDDDESQAVNFDRDLQSLIHLPDFQGVRAIVIGRFQKASGISDDLLMKIIKSKKELANIPVIANVDFGHTDPKITFPVGGEASLIADPKKIKLEIIKH
ncbi:MAG: LD-carboxypeptidase [bacterium]|nr:LD-carboxypeptidase [bacterium]